MTTNRRSLRMYADERRAFDTLSKKVDRELARATVNFGPMTPMKAFLALVQGGPADEAAFHEMLLSASVNAVKDKLAAEGSKPAPLQAEAAGAQIAREILAARERRHRESVSVEPNSRVLRLLVLAYHEHLESYPFPDFPDLPRSLSADLTVARDLGLDVQDVQMILTFAKGLLVVSEVIREVYPAIRLRVGEVWRRHQAEQRAEVYA
jgi:hypothetical protein